MNDRTSFIRFGILGGQFFDIPYKGEAPFRNIVTTVKAEQGFRTEALWIPYHAIAFMHEVPSEGAPAWAAATGDTAQ